MFPCRRSLFRCPDHCRDLGIGADSDSARVLEFGPKPFGPSTAEEGIDQTMRKRGPEAESDLCIGTTHGHIDRHDPYVLHVIIMVILIR
jgi:hypothetical protein